MSKLKYKRGDKVKVRDDLKKDMQYGIYCVTGEMYKFTGKIVTISVVYDDSYKIEGCSHEWFTDEMLESVDLSQRSHRFKVGDKVKFRDGLEIGKRYDGYSYSSCLHRDLGGKIMTIWSVMPDGYSVKECSSYTLTDDMLELADSSDSSEYSWSITIQSPQIKLSFL